MKGVDISSYQKGINFDKFKEDKIDFAMVRLGFGENTEDREAVHFVRELTKKDIPWGGYWFSYAGNAKEAEKEAKKCLSMISQCRPLFPIAFDFEYDSVFYQEKRGNKITKKKASEIVEAFCSTIEKHGFYTSIYTNEHYINSYFDESLFKKYDLWYAQWNTDKPKRTCGMWQYTDKGKLKCFPGSIDVNIAYHNYPEIIKKNNLNIYKP